MTRTMRTCCLCASLLIAALTWAAAGCADAPPADGTPAAKAPPRGVVEDPPEGQSDNKIRVTGWAGDDVGIRLVRVSIDGHLVALADFVVERPDVTRVYPQLRHGTDRYGYETVVDNIPPGGHVVTVEAVDTDGLSTALGQRHIQVVLK
jgi:hypothetical protein